MARGEEALLDRIAVGGMIKVRNLFYFILFEGNKDFSFENYSFHHFV